MKYIVIIITYAFKSLLLVTADVMRYEFKLRNDDIMYIMLLLIIMLIL